MTSDFPLATMSMTPSEQKAYRTKRNSPAINFIYLDCKTVGFLLKIGLESPYRWCDIFLQSTPSLTLCFNPHPRPFLRPLKRAFITWAVLQSIVYPALSDSPAHTDKLLHFDKNCYTCNLWTTSHL